jgi:hypothetical protein
VTQSGRVEARRWLVRLGRPLIGVGWLLLAGGLFYGFTDAPGAAHILLWGGGGAIVGGLALSFAGGSRGGAAPVGRAVGAFAAGALIMAGVASLAFWGACVMLSGGRIIDFAGQFAFSAALVLGGVLLWWVTGRRHD